MLRSVAVGDWLPWTAALRWGLGFKRFFPCRRQRVLWDWGDAFVRIAAHCLVVTAVVTHAFLRLHGSTPAAFKALGSDAFDNLINPIVEAGLVDELNF